LSSFGLIGGCAPQLPILRPVRFIGRGSTRLSVAAVEIEENPAAIRSYPAAKEGLPTTTRQILYNWANGSTFALSRGSTYNVMTPSMAGSVTGKASGYRTLPEGRLDRVERRETFYALAQEVAAVFDREINAAIRDSLAGLMR